MTLFTLSKPFRIILLCTIPLLGVLFSGQSVMAQKTVTAVYSDYGGYWNSSMTGIKPDSSHNLLAFNWGGTIYSTGVNDALLDTKGVSYNAQKFRAFPIAAVPTSTSTSFYIMLGQLYDGVANGITNPPPFPTPVTSAVLASFLTDGVRGLNLGTGLANIPSSSALRFNLSSNGITLSSINDGIPDILISQEATPGTASPDFFQFVDQYGNVVGHPDTVITANFPALSTWQVDFYIATGASSGSMVNGNRPLAFYALDLNDFGLNASNYMNAVALLYKPNGTSDPAFLAFNEPSVSIATKVILTTQPSTYTTNVTLSPGPAIQIKDGLGRPINQSGIPVTVSLASGSGTLSGTTTDTTDNTGSIVFSNLNISSSSTITFQFKSTSLDAAISSNITPVALPLTWLSFTGEDKGNGVLLRWSTTDEQNTKDFLVQYSVDLTSWQNIGTVTATDKETVSQYQFTDVHPVQKKSYYRLIQRDLDEKSSYSTIIAIQPAGTSQPIVIYPNPIINGQLNIKLSSPAAAALYSSTGQLVLRKELLAGLQQVNTGGLPKGLYNLVIDKIAYKIEIVK